MTRGAIVFLLLLLMATAAGLYLTRDQPSAPATGPSGPASGPSAKEAPAPVDLQPLLTAQELAREATAEEQSLAQEAFRLADHQTDLALAAALSEAVAHPPPSDARTTAILAQLQNAEKQLAQSKERVAHTTKPDDLAVAKIQLEIDQDDVDDVKQDLERAGGAPQARISRMMEQREALDRGNPSAETGKPSISATLTSHGLVGKVQEWYGLRQRVARIVDAQHAALAAVTSLGVRHETQKQSAAKERAKARELAGQSSASSDGASAMLSQAQRAASAQKEMVALNKRAADDKQLAEVYGNWAMLLGTYQRQALHGVLLSASLVLLTLIVVLIAGAWFDHYCDHLAIDRSRLLSLRHVLRATVQGIGLCVILLLCFGPPAQLSTVLGLLGAAATLALHDFIIGFFGWFVLMGENGIRLGDWVEINGVGGEVASIGLFRTVLLETGNWTDAGHPTGRRVTFVNSFAITGHYFNFSTSGQWLWDELRFTIPIGKDPEPLIEEIKKQVLGATAEDTQLAEEEWKRLEQTDGMTAFSGDPAVHLRPSTAGVEVVVRYITRAAQRQPMRAKLYSAVVAVLGSNIENKNVENRN